MMKKFKIGLQLYSICDEVKENMDAALENVKKMGYDFVEFAGYFGKSAEEVRALLNKHGLECVSVHQDPQLFFEEGQKAIDFLKVIGAKYCAIPWYDIENKDWSDTVGKFMKLGSDLKKNGIKLLYHNHTSEFVKRDGEYLLDKLFEDVPSDLLSPEFDTGWVLYAGEDQCEYLKKYSGRVEVLHLKDFVSKKFSEGFKDMKDNPSDDEFFFRPCGSGVTDFEKILETAEECGTEYIIVEVEKNPVAERTPMEEAKISIDYLKTICG